MKLTAIVIEDNEIFRAKVVECLKDMDEAISIIGEYGDGESALEAIEFMRPQVILLDLIIPQPDGISILEYIQKIDGYRPMVLAMSVARGSGLTQRILDLGAAYFLIKPFDMKVLRARLEMLIRWEAQRDDAEFALENGVTTIFNALLLRDIASCLHKLAMPPNVSGYQYLMDAINITVKDIHAIGNMTKHLYPVVAEKHSTTPERVERSMRHAIEMAWNRCRAQDIEEIFGYSLDVQRDKPSNSQFIAMITDRVRLRHNML